MKLNIKYINLDSNCAALHICNSWNEMKWYKTCKEIRWNETSINWKVNEMGY